MVWIIYEIVHLFGVGVTIVKLFCDAFFCPKKCLLGREFAVGIHGAYQFHIIRSIPVLRLHKGPIGHKVPHIAIPLGAHCAHAIYCEVAAVFCGYHVVAFDEMVAKHILAFHVIGYIEASERE